MTRKELIDTAMLCTVDMTCDGCPYSSKRRNMDCMDELIFDLAKELTKEENRMKKIKWVNSGSYYILESCPICGEYVRDTDGTAHKFCPGCGQAIDWGDE